MKYHFSIIDDSHIGPNKEVFSTHFDEEIQCDSLLECGKLLTEFHTAAAWFKDKRRKKVMATICNFLQFDFDTGIEPKEVIEKIDRYDYLIIGSKNHLRDKGDGLGTIPRFHLYIPTEPSIDNHKFYRFLINHFGTKWNFPFDRSCKDISRYFFKGSTIVAHRENGRRLQIKNLRSKMLSEEIESKFQQMRMNALLAKKQMNGDFTSKWTFEKIKRLKKWEEKRNDIINPPQKDPNTKRPSGTYGAILSALCYLHCFNTFTFEQCIQFIDDETNKTEKIMANKSALRRGWNSLGSN